MTLGVPQNKRASLPKVTPLADAESGVMGRLPRRALLRRDIPFNNRAVDIDRIADAESPEWTNPRRL
jgi:hypothetical protein